MTESTPGGPSSDLEAASYEAAGALHDGTPVRVRAVRPDDKARLREGFRRLSADSVRHRFFEMKRDLTEEELAYFTELDFDRHVAIVATVEAGGGERIVGVVRYVVTGEEPVRRAETAFTVADDFQGRGLGTLLFEHLVRIARANGVGLFEADVLGDNRRMLAIFRQSGFRVRHAVDGGVVHIWLDIQEPGEGHGGAGGGGPGDGSRGA